MALADDLRAICYTARAIPGSMGLRPYTVAVLTGTWSGLYTGRGTEATSSVAITESGGQPPKVRFPKDEEIALGQLAEGDVIIGPITPYFGTGGATLAQLAPAVAAGSTVHVVVTGPGHTTGTKYRIRDIKTDRALHWIMRCTPVNRVA